MLKDSIDVSSKEINDSDWKDVQLPHDWSIGLPVIEPGQGKMNLGSMGFMQGGIGWYRKLFSVPSGDKKVFIHFDGVYHQSDVYINGKHLGFHPYGYTSFEYDITPWLNGKENYLDVKVDHSNYPSSRWYSGSGIYRHVWLVMTEKIHVPLWGIQITTQEVSEEKARVNINTSVLNSSGEGQNVIILNRILDNENREIASIKSPVRLENGISGNTDQTLILKDPRLWSIEKPYLYVMETTISVNSKVTDIFRTRFGIRYFRFDPDKGFFLNGKNIKLKGVNLHQDAGSLGTAVPDMSYLRRLKILKEYGCNAVRCSHNPPSPEFLDICDSLGFVVIDEAFDKWRSGYYAKFFNDWWKKDLDAMILRDRNHPSVFMWSIGNETQEQNEPTGAAVAKMLRDHVHAVDPTRPVTAAISPSNVLTRPYIKNGFTATLDVVGYNYQEPWLSGDKLKFPGLIMYIAEAFPYYSSRNNSIRDYNPKNPWYTVQNNDYVAGQFVWAGADYLGESSGWPSTGWPTGLFDVCMFEKPRAAFHRSVWNDKPIVRIAVVDQSLDIDPGKDHWSWPNLAENWNFPKYKGHIIEVQTISNCDSVELMVNAATMGKRAVADYLNNTIVWHVPYIPGRIEATGYTAGKDVAKHALYTSGRPSKILLVPDRKELSSDGQDILHLMIQIVDDKGITVPDADELVTVAVSGPGRIIGIDNGDLRREISLTGNTIKSSLGKALAIIQSSTTPGDILVRVRFPGLPESALKVTSK